MLTPSEIEKIKDIYPGIIIKSEYLNNEGRYITNFKINSKYSTKQTAKFRLEAKLGRKLNKDETVDHIDGNSINDSLPNLQLLSRRANIQKAWKDGSMSNSAKNIYKYINSDKNKKDKQGDKNGMSKITFDEVRNYRILHDSNKITKKEITAKTGLTRRAIEKFLKNESYVDPEYSPMYKTKEGKHVLIRKCKELYDEGISKSQIARELSIDRGTVRIYLNS